MLTGRSLVTNLATPGTHSSHSTHTAARMLEHRQDLDVQPCQMSGIMYVSQPNGLYISDYQGIVTGRWKWSSIVLRIGSARTIVKQVVLTKR